jgi:DUF4097 and DUF4098 domain-containing protein YvlB
MKTPKMKLLFPSVVLIALPLLMDAQNRRTGRFDGVDVNRNGPVTNCGDIRVSYSRRPAVTEETETTVPASQISTLRAQLTNNGIHVNGWDRNEYSIKTCKAVPYDDPNPSSTLREITTSISNGEITLRGPNDREWMANLIVMVPRLSSIDLHTSNGPMELRDLAGNIQLNASNGPISLDNVGGFVQATTANGPMSLKNASGDQRLTATNGPISVTLSGNEWVGPGLEASTRNGPMALSFPEAYGSAIQIQTSDRAPISCKASACNGATRSLGSPSVIRIGNGNPVVRLSTVNGPVSIQSKN